MFRNAGSDPNADYLARLNPDGTLDSAFTAAAPVLSYYVDAIAVQSDDKIVIGGCFDERRSLDARLRRATRGQRGLGHRIRPPDPQRLRLLGGSGRVRQDRDRWGVRQRGQQSRSWTTSSAWGSDGTLDTDFVPLTLGTDVYSVALVEGGKVLVGGLFQNAGGDPGTDRLARANSDGSRDTAFAPVSLDNSVRTVRYLSDGKYLIGGQFGNAGYVGVNRLGVTIPSPGPLAFSPDPLAFGNVTVGATETKTVTVTNNGTAAMTPSAITPAGTGVSVTGGTCAVGTPVSVGATCTIEVRWIPAAAGALSGGSVTVAYPDGDRAQWLGLGDGDRCEWWRWWRPVVAAWPLTFSPDPVDFGKLKVGDSESVSVTVTNTGTAAVKPTAITVAGADVEVIWGHVCHRHRHRCGRVLHGGTDLVTGRRG